LVFISTDFVIDPGYRCFPQNEEVKEYAASGYGYHKRQCELEFMKDDTGSMMWTILRPCHIYGPGSLLGCLPNHSRDAELLSRLRKGEALKLVGGGHFLQQPIFAADLTALILSCAGNAKSDRQIFMAAGPEIVESREYYRIIADLLNVKLRIEELPVAEFLAGNPDAAPFLCHRIYDLAKLRAAGLVFPSTPLANGLQQQVASLQEVASAHPAMG
jgi:nucleoside-diphosphate-sugar epimerase